MAKRITKERLIKYAKYAGLGSIPLGIVLIIFLINLGSIEVIDYTKDITCGDTCFVNVTFKANEDIFIYPFDSSWLEVDNKKAVHLIKTYRTWGTGLRELKFNETCNGAWCGCYWCDKNNQAKYSYVFRSGKTYTLVYEITKDSKADIKWGWFNGLVDPLLIGEKETDDIFTELKSNDGKTKKATFEMYSPSVLNSSNLKIHFNEVCGKVKDYKINYVGDCFKEIDMPVFGNKTICEPDIDETLNIVIGEKCYDVIDIVGYETVNESYNCVKELDDTIPYGATDYTIEADIEIAKCSDGKFGYSIDWIPELITLTDDKFKQDKWAWFNQSFDYKRDITEEPISDLAFAVNSTTGFCDYTIWTNPLDDDLSLYYNNCSSFEIVANDTSTANYEVEELGTGNNPTSVYDNDLVAGYHFGDISSDDMTIYNGTTGTAGKIGNAYEFDGVDDYINIGNDTILNDMPLNDFSISAWIYDTREDNLTLGTIWGTYIAPSGWSLRTISNASGIRSIYFSIPFNETSSTYQSLPGSITSNTWHHAVIVYDVGTKTSKIYIDGSEGSYELETQGVGTYISDSSNMKNIGQLPHAGGIQLFNGTIDDIRIYNASLSATQITSLYNSGSGTQQENINPDNLVFHSTMESGVDVTSNDNDGSVYGATWSSDGKYGGAFEFDGVEGGILIDDADEFDFNEFSINVWINPLNITPPDNDEIIDKRTSDTWSWYLRLEEDGHIDFNIINSTGGSVLLTTTDTISSGWIMVTAIMNGTHSLLYIDGTLNSTPLPFQGTVRITDDNITIGAQEYLGDFYHMFNGTIDEVRIYNRSLSATEIEELYNNSVAGRNMNLDDEKRAVCTYDTGDWIIDCSDNCELDATDISGNNIIINQSGAGTGNLTFAGNITNTGNISTSGFNSTDRCYIRCDGNGCFG